MEKSIAVLGLGKFGKSLAKNLYELGADVLAVDCDEDVVAEFASKSTAAICANLNNEDEVTSLGLKDVDIVVTAMGSNLAASILAVSVAKEQGVKTVIAKTTSERMSTILKKVGADTIVDPEEDGGARAARILVSTYLKDCFKLDDNMFIASLNPKEEWIGKTLNDLELRKNANINVVAMRENKSYWRFVDPNEEIKEEHSLLVVMEKKTMRELRVEFEKKEKEKEKEREKEMKKNKK